MAEESGLSWLFLSHRFRVFFGSDILSNRGVRVGRHPDDAPWVNVNLNRAALDVDHDDSDEDSDDSDGGTWGLARSPWLRRPAVKERLRLLHEALVLTSLVAKTDYDNWRTMMRDFAFFDVASAAQCVQFSLTFEQEHDVAFLDWSTSLELLLGGLDDGGDDAFQRDLAKVYDVLTRRGVRIEELEPTPIKIVFVPRPEVYAYEDVSRRVLRLVAAVQHTQALEETAQSCGATCGTLFKITALEINVAEVVLHGHVLEALISLLHVGVPVTLLRLPKLGSDRPSLNQWGTFVRLITGLDRDDSGRQAAVRRIEMPITYIVTVFYGAFCSALAFAKGVDQFVLSGVKDRYATDLSEHDKKNRLQLWRWLAFALCSSAARSSVTALSINGERPFPSEIKAFATIASSSDPFQIMGDLAFDETDAINKSTAVGPTGSVVTLPSRTVVCVRADSWTGDCQHPCDVSATVLATTSASGEAKVFVPGYGFCLTQLVPRPSKRAKREPSGTGNVVTARATRSLRSLVLRPHFHLDPQREEWLDLLQIVGPHLRSLCIEAHLDQDATERMLVSCPKLTRLAVSRVTLSSMSVFDDAARTNGLALSSLCLDRVDVTILSEEAFVRSLGQPNPPAGSVAATLQRLYWGSHWPERSSDSTLQLFQNVLENNTTLTHLIGNYSDGMHAPTELVKFHGKCIPGLDPNQRGQLLAFLSAVRGLSSMVDMDALIKQTIWEFAITPRYRTVVWTLDRSWGLFGL